MPDINFETELYNINDWLIAKLPSDASKQLPSRGQVMVKGTINGHPIHDALEPDGDGGHWLHINDDLQKATGIGSGDTVALEIEATKDWPEPTIPADVQKQIVMSEDTKPLWDRVTPMARWEWLRWINSTANPDTRQKRIEVSRSKLLNGMRRPCCFNRSMCCVPAVSKSGVLMDAVAA
jgi:hypothetical protein